MTEKTVLVLLRRFQDKIYNEKQFYRGVSVISVCWSVKDRRRTFSNLIKFLFVYLELLS